MTAQTGKDVTEDAAAAGVAVAGTEARPARPARKKVRRVRVIEVIDDGEDDDLQDVLEALDEEDAERPEPEDPEPGEPEPPAAEPEAAKPETPKPEPKPARRPAFRRRLPLVPVLVVVLVAALATACLVLWRSQHDLSSKEDARRDVIRTVTDYGNVVLSYDRTDLRGSVARAQSYLTGDALAKSKETNVAQLQKSMDEGQFTMTSKTDQVYVASADGRFASVVLVFDISVKSPAGSEDVTRNYLNLSLVHQDGKWRISQQTPAGRESDGTATGGGVPALDGGQAPEDTKESGKPENKD